MLNRPAIWYLLLCASAAQLAVTGPALSGTWVSRTALPISLGYIDAEEVGGKIYTFGGWTGGTGHTDAVFEYDPSTDSWLSKSPMPTSRSTAVTCEVGGYVYVIGGQISIPGTTNIQRLDVVERYDPFTDRWTTRTSMPTARNAATCSVVNGKIYVIGGRTRDFPADNLSTVEEYDPASDSWTTKSPMPTPRSGTPTSSVVNGKIYVIGGFNPHLGGPLDTVEEYDPVVDGWSARASLPIARYGPTSVSLGHQVFVLGGYDLATWHSRVDVYDALLDAWTSFDPMLTGRGFAGSAVVDGDVYVIGGQRETSPLDAVERAGAGLPFLPPLATFRQSGFGFGDDWEVRGCFTRPYCDPLFDPPGRRYRHVGLDAAAVPGIEVLASAGGTVVLAQDELGGVGGAVVIQHDLDGNSATIDDLVTTLYLHVDPLVSPGQTVEQGHLVATIASIAEPHLHFGYREAAFDPTDPSASVRGALPPEGTLGCRPCFGMPVDLPVFPEAWRDPVEILFPSG